MRALLGPELFRFETYTQWRCKAKSWYDSFGVNGTNTIALDARGRVCAWGAHFERAERHHTYPIIVYLLDCDAQAPEAERLRLHRERLMMARLGGS